MAADEHYLGIVAPTPFLPGFVCGPFQKVSGRPCLADVVRAPGLRGGLPGVPASPLGVSGVGRVATAVEPPERHASAPRQRRVLKL
jgi:hypothetical protein